MQNLQDVKCAQEIDDTVQLKTEMKKCEIEHKKINFTCCN